MTCRPVPQLARLVAAALLVAVAACASEASEAPRLTPWAELRTFEAGGTPAALWLPEGDPEGLVVFHHGAGDTIESLVAAQHTTSLMGAITEAGWAVAASEAHGDNWGNQASLDANRALWEQVTEVIDPPRVVLIGGSMGGLSSLGCIVHRCVPRVDGWVGIYPLIDQRTMASSSARDTALPSIRDAFDGPVPPSHIPIEHPDRLAAVPMLVWASQDDEVVPTEGNALALTQAVEAAGGSVDLRLVRGPHLAPVYDLDVIVAFLDGL